LCAANVAIEQCAWDSADGRAFLSVLYCTILRYITPAFAVHVFVLVFCACACGACDLRSHALVQVNLPPVLRLSSPGLLTGLRPCMLATLVLLPTVLGAISLLDRRVTEVDLPESRGDSRGTDSVQLHVITTPICHVQSCKPFDGRLHARSFCARDKTCQREPAGRTRAEGHI